MVLMRYILSFFIILVINSLPISGQQKVAGISGFEKVNVLREHFINNSNHWITDNNYISGKLIDGRYILTCKNYMNSSGLSSPSVNLDYSKNFEIEAAFTIIKGTGGFLFGMTDNYDHYRVELTNNRDMLIIKNTISKSKLDVLYTSPNHSSINAGSSNKITIRKVENKYFFLLNDIPVKELTNIKPEGTKVGFNVGLNSEISVEYLNISYLIAKITPILANGNITKKDSALSVLQGNNNSRDSKTTTDTDNRGDPVLSWTSPSALKTTYDSYTAPLKAFVKSESELTSVLFYVNGSPKGQAEWKLVPGQPGIYRIDKTINLDPGENIVYFTATNLVGSKKSEERYFTIPEATKPVISWSMPEAVNVLVDNERFVIEVCIKSPSGLKTVKVLVNGENMGSDNVFKMSNSENCNIRWQYPIILREGFDNSVVVYAENSAGTAPSEARIIRYSKAIAERRIALVIGNSNYGTKTPLKNPIQDANLMEATLEGLGFVVEKHTDLGLKEMNAAIREFCQKMKEYNVALFYYAGHGVQVEGKNYLIPVDAKLATKDDCEWEAFAVDDLLNQFEKNPKNINIAILDACRSNPFTGWVRGEQAGFMPLNKTNGMFISFATAPGSTAADGTSGNGLFTTELVKQMNIHQPISSVFLNTRVNVWEKSNQTQRPQEWNDLNGEFFFKK